MCAVGCMRVRLCVCVKVLCMNVGVWVCVVCGMYAIWWKHLFKASQNNMGADILNILSTVGIKDLSPAVFTPGSTSWAIQHPEDCLLSPLLIWEALLLLVDWDVLFCCCFSFSTLFYGGLIPTRGGLSPNTVEPEESSWPTNRNSLNSTLIKHCSQMNTH